MCTYTLDDILTGLFIIGLIVPLVCVALWRGWEKCCQYLKKQRMKQCLLIILCCLWTPSAQAALLYSTQIITAQGSCSVSVPTQTWEWTNTTQQSLYIKSVDLGVSMNRGAQTDLSSVLYRSGDWAPLVTLGWDHYTDPVAPVHQRQSFAPDAMLLVPGESVYLIVECAPLSTRRSTYLHSVTIWWAFNE